MQLNVNSYTAASALPVKLLQDGALIRRIKSGFIPPVHVQLIPTNRCNLSCGFCSCSQSDRKLTLDPDRLLGAMSQFKAYGCRSVTVTGGGEPLLYPEISAILGLIRQGMQIKIGLVTNGTQFHRLARPRDLTWCRISSSDDREPDWEGIERAVTNGPNVDWAFSHVLTRNPDWDRLARLVEFANSHRFTHVRLVADLLDIAEAGPLVKFARLRLQEMKQDDRLVIYQDRVSYVRGKRNCGISLLKPVVGADGFIYPCCGVQYAQEPPSRNLGADMRMGDVEGIKEIWEAQQAFDGQNCYRCYYDDYNRALGLLQSKLTHEEFV